MSKHKNHGHECSCGSGTVTAAQSLDELEFEKGIWSAAQYGELDKIVRLVENRKCCVDQRDSAGYTALHYAARNGQLDVCKYLIKNGAHVNAMTQAGQATSLHRACSAGKRHIVDFLLSVKADVSLRDGDGKTALHRASENGHKEISQLLGSNFPHLKDVADNKGNKPKIV